MPEAYSCYCSINVKKLWLSSQVYASYHPIVLKLMFIDSVMIFQSNFPHFSFQNKITEKKV